MNSIPAKYIRVHALWKLVGYTNNLWTGRNHLQMVHLHYEDSNIIWLGFNVKQTEDNFEMYKSGVLIK